MGKLTQFFLAYLQHKDHSEMKNIVAFCLLTHTLACTSEETLGNMIVQGQIKGLKKGTLYLQKMKDTLVVTVDSVAVLGKDTFTLSDYVASPEMYYLTLNTNTDEQKYYFLERLAPLRSTIEYRFWGKCIHQRI